MVLCEQMIRTYRWCRARHILWQHWSNRPIARIIGRGVLQTEPHVAHRCTPPPFPVPHLSPIYHPDWDNVDADSVEETQWCVKMRRGILTPCRQRRLAPPLHSLRTFSFASSFSLRATGRPVSAGLLLFSYNVLVVVACRWLSGTDNMTLVFHFLCR